MGNFYMLPVEIMLEILSRVPADSILECKSASKPWRNVVQHPSFSLMHLNHLNDLDSSHDSGCKLGFLFYTVRSREEPFYYTEFDKNLICFSRITRMNLKPPFEYCYILGSRNGLVCFNAHSDRGYFQPACICNPVTREYIVFAKVEGKHFLSGFGYTPSTNEYKVLRICKNKGDPNYGIIQIYTLGSGIGWRNGRKMDYDVTSFGERGVFADGAVHWESGKATIVAFDLIEEEFRQLPSPPCLLPVIVELVGVLSDFLCACYHYAGGFDTWVLKKNKSNHDVIWSKEFSNINGKPINFTKSGGLLCYDSCDRNFYWYASKASPSRMLVSSGNSFNFGVPHKNTLVSLKALGEEDTKLMDSGERARFEFNWETESIGHSSWESKEEGDL